MVISVGAFFGSHPVVLDEKAQQPPARPLVLKIFNLSGVPKHSSFEGARPPYFFARESCKDVMSKAGAGALPKGLYVLQESLCRAIAG